ncbi:[acyl-carrier-protein] S-malonyltransferase [Candidatus Kinetoplastibacterium blastocrithidii TCC012E]|uniref:Malonyl CoA-acyl carrier protein transacylase n=1 Tax=Candidatus Kinetoplastidibacterium blastocrithidiae TCC012E TaxID=1208922 RepID=M1MDT8_9PROT|nr:ACP S-malonyltransferase [Candidatus Kinetoplastibacterium blastocrithidii]AFZ83767.1 malonyl CoA-acyl carrier protein transacylase [Candidatus Kinetoplastibacterium blastocrithidii (ex Strigomonas culicis)]AGF49890.1 [acyl-carrier-protein] S-malonyltransferase [Candidatus Kinetoplastibacterium blastocrithidii TCC012E]
MKIAFVFPGQGSQYLGMLDSWNNETINSVMLEASSILKQDLKSLISKGPLESLNLTVNTQPIMLAVCLSFFLVWRESGGRDPDIMAGHSLGEYTALAASGAISFSDCLRLVRYRAELMQSVIPADHSAMAAIIGIEQDDVVLICNRNSNDVHIVEIANYNSPLQIVIAGHKDAVISSCKEAKALGAKRTIMLPVSAPFHSTILKPISKYLFYFLDSIDIKAPKVDVINNVDVKIENDPVLIRDALVRQAWSPVRWVETVQYMKMMGVTHILEFGPGSVLSNLIKRIDPELVTISIRDYNSLNKAIMLVN